MFCRYSHVCGSPENCRDCPLSLELINKWIEYWQRQRVAKIEHLKSIRRLPESEMKKEIRKGIN